MDFSLSPEQMQFRDELRAFFTSEPVRQILQGIDHAPRALAHAPQIYRWMGERGWLAPDWATAYGGLGKTRIEAAIVTEELHRHGVPDLAHVVTITIVGAVLLFAGTPEQQARFLPLMARGQMGASILYSEPDAGSDLSSLLTTAQQDGNEYVLRGTKIWSQGTEFADYGLVVARTTTGRTKYDGITLFLVPLNAPGVEIRPIWNISDDRFSEVFFDGARVPAENIIGPLHGGWHVINGALALERTGLDFYVKMRKWLDTIILRARQIDRLTDPRIGATIASLDAQVQAGRLISWKVISQLARGEVDEVSSAMAKWYNTEIGRTIARLAIEMDGLDALLSRWDQSAPMDGIMEAAYREIPGLTISAGTSEIMLYLVAAVGLKLYQ